MSTQPISDESLAGFAERIQAALAAAPAGLDTGHIQLDFPRRPLSMNGYTNGLTGQNVLLTPGEFVHYMRRAHQYMVELRPVGMREGDAAQRIIDAAWRLHRVPALEQNLFNTGLLDAGERPTGNERSDQVANQCAAFRNDCAGPNSFEKLGRHEARLHKAVPQLHAEFERLQSNRYQRMGREKFEAAESTAIEFYAGMLKIAAQIEDFHKRKSAAAANAEKQTTSETNPDLQNTPGAGRARSAVSPSDFRAMAAAIANCFPPERIRPHSSSNPYSEPSAGGSCRTEQ